MCPSPHIFDLLPLLRVSVSSVNCASISPPRQSPITPLQSKLRGNLMKKTPFNSVPSVLFHFPYPVSPLLATHTKSAGVWPNSSHSGTLRPQFALPAVFKFFLFTLFHALSQ